MGELMYKCVTADPPWRFADKLGKRGAEANYPCMSVEDLCKLELPPIADDAILFLWRVSSMQEEALAVMHMWGFDLKAEMVWVKCKNGVIEPDDENDLAFGMGHYTRAAHETCLIGTRGKAIPLIKSKNLRSVFFAERGKHSEKPEKFYELVEKLATGPYLELFARRHRPNWTCIGSELGTVLNVA